MTQCLLALAREYAVFTSGLLPAESATAARLPREETS